MLCIGHHSHHLLLNTAVFKWDYISIKGLDGNEKPTNNNTPQIVWSISIFRRWRKPFPTTSASAHTREMRSRPTLCARPPWRAPPAGVTPAPSPAPSGRASRRSTPSSRSAPSPARRESQSDARRSIHTYSGSWRWCSDTNLYLNSVFTLHLFIYLPYSIYLFNLLIKLIKFYLFILSIYSW